MIITKIADIKKNGSKGDKVTVYATVRQVKEVNEYPSNDGGTFKTQDVMISDGPQDNAYTNSIWCKFYADNGTWNHLRGQAHYIKGTVDIYNDRIKLKNCLPVKQDSPQTPQNAPQSTNAPQADSKPDWDKKDLRIVAQCFGKVFAEFDAKGELNPEVARQRAREWVLWAWNIDTKPHNWSEGDPAEHENYEPDDDISF